MSLNAKVLLVGPPGAGKTVLAKYIFSRDPEELAFIEQTHEEKEFENFKLDLASEGDISTYPVRIHERMAENFQVGSSQLITSGGGMCSSFRKSQKYRFFMCFELRDIILVSQFARNGFFNARLLSTDFSHFSL